METTIEYRVRPVTRYIVTEFEQCSDMASCGEVGEFRNEADAERAALAFARSHAVDERADHPVTTIVGHDGRVWKLRDGQWEESHELSDVLSTGD